MSPFRGPGLIMSVMAGIDCEDLAHIRGGQGFFWYVRLNADGRQNLGSAVY